MHLPSHAFSETSTAVSAMVAARIFAAAGIPVAATGCCSIPVTFTLAGILFLLAVGRVYRWIFLRACCRALKAGLRIAGLLLHVVRMCCCAVIQWNFRGLAGRRIGVVPRRRNVVVVS